MKEEEEKKGTLLKISGCAISGAPQMLKLHPVPQSRDCSEPDRRVQFCSIVGVKKTGDLDKRRFTCVTLTL